ncbi:uncharacterized protein KD926_000287 [Aspergillus affinis]|uniref:uncharacterized protein n=1 Tax=Aspergillus affinis TaxID=1070780 RepID=UPI0022FEC8AF|nr:uncharacterized protein KD926_000287 [Aspergillus affinis]KAI9037492.1 hypothetical protein KD926_000287 [Aspergillus affinis]
MAPVSRDRRALGRHTSHDAIYQPFIVTTSLGRPNKATRKLIRSHVMRGKNRAKHVEAGVVYGSWINSSLPAKPAGILKAEETGLWIPQPRTLCRDLETFTFADQIKPYMLDLIFKFFTILKQSVYPIEFCLEFDPKASVWYKYLLSDAACHHSLLWTTQSYFDWIQGYSLSPKALFHEAKTLELLQYRINDPASALNDTTIAVVVTLVMVSALVGHVSVVKKHMQGLNMIITLRGGMRELEKNAQLQIKVCRADLCTALLSGSEPFFFSEEMTWQPYLARPADINDFLATHFAGCNIDKRLAGVAADLRRFSISTNLAFATGRKIAGEVYQETLISTQYRLATLKFDSEDINELLRLGLLVFSSSVFLQGGGLRGRFPSLSARFKQTLSKVDWTNPVPKRIGLWLLISGLVAAVTHEDDDVLIPLLQDRCRESGQYSWSGVRSILKSVMWIDALQDKSGRQVYDRAILVEQI